MKFDTDSDPFDEYVEARLAGHNVQIPDEYHTEVLQAVAAHRALQNLLAGETKPQTSKPEFRPPPDVSDRFTIERELGHGGMRVVYLARQKTLNRYVALKVLRPGERSFTRLLHRFREEAQHLAKLRHPNIVTIHDIGEAAGEPYFTMDYIDGEPLSGLIARGALPPTQAVAILQQVSAAVQFAHRKGIIHRDLKPANVLLDRSGRAYVSDFGLARSISGDSHLTQSGELLGTPQYMSPEQARGQLDLVGEATDIHALGLLLYEMLTGQPAFKAASPAEIIVKLLNEEPRTLRSFDKRIPRDLETICFKALHKSPSNRYSSVSVLQEDLARFEAGEPILARRAGSLHHIGKWCRRHWKIAMSLLLTTSLALAIGPTLFDKPVEALMIWADEEMVEGNPEIAARVYARAFKKAKPSQKKAIAERIVVTCRQLDDSSIAVGLAMLVIDLVPNASFGIHDYLVAQGLVALERANSPAGALDVWAVKETPRLQLIESRLEIASQMELQPKQRIDLEETLVAVKLAIDVHKPDRRLIPGYLYQLPSGSVDELLPQVMDEQSPIWNRAKAAIALGQLYEKQWRTQDALAAYQQAIKLVRLVYPMVGGVKAASGANTSRVDVPDAEECRLVSELAASLRRLSAEENDFAQGNIEFVVKGFELPESIGIDLVLELCDPGIDNPNQGLAHNLPRLIPLHQNGPITVQVLDGKYRIRTKGHHSRWDNQAEQISRRIQVDIDGWPEQIDIAGNTVRLPAVHLRLADEIDLLLPPNAEPIKLSEVEFEWTPIEGATQYQIQLLYTSEQPTPITHFFLSITTQKPRLRLIDLDDAEQSSIRTNLIAGRTGGWRVDAYDIAGKLIGKSIVENRFLVAEELPAPNKQ